MSGDFPHQASFRRVLLQEDFDRFARLTGDDNPIHCDPFYAQHTHFGATVSHGMLLYGLIAKALSELLPGPGVRQLTQELMFPNPTYTGEEIRIELECQDRAPDGALDILTRVSKAEDVITAEGRTRVLPQGIPTAPAIEREITGEGASDAELYGLRLGKQAEASRSFNARDLAEYGDLVGDRNPLFRGAAAEVPGALLAGMFSDLLGTRLPGRGTGWMKQRLQFLSPARPGEALLARVEITRLRAAKELVNLRTEVFGPGQRLVVDGEALVLVRNLENRQAR
ncbi:(R)-specific enoyl-CoA hydratase [Burkholderiales bacterium]|nr:(R)-specific enoyl-CoA hydratase [Burkholderiales bacterium]